MRSRLVLLLLVLFVTTLALWSVALPGASAQTPGVIEGEVRPGPGATVDVDGVTVQLLGIREGTRTVQETRTSGGRFRFELPSVSGNATYIVRAEVEGVTYLAPTPVLLSPEVPAARVEIEVYASTTERPALTSQATGLTVVFVDVRGSQLTLQREDLVVNPTARTWVGGADGVTLHLPTLAGAQNLEGEAWYEGLPALGEFTLADSEVVARVALRPGVTLVTTRFAVPFDLTTEVESLRLQAALPADTLQLLVPQRFTRTLAAGTGGILGEPLTIEGERVLVVTSPGRVEAGAAIEARAGGLGGRLEPNALAGRTGAVLGAVLALVIIAGGAHLASRASRPAAPPVAPEGA